MSQEIGNVPAQADSMGFKSVIGGVVTDLLTVRRVSPNRNEGVSPTLISFIRRFKSRGKPSLVSFTPSAIKSG